MSRPELNELILPALNAAAAADWAGSRGESAGQDDDGGKLHGKRRIDNDGEGWKGGRELI